jgi:hypothetical protein
MLEEVSFWPYLAGIIDGEGHISIYNAAANLSVANTHLGLLEYVKETTGHGSITKMAVKYGRASQAYKWMCYSTGIRVIVPRVLPYLIVKREKALLLMEYLEGFAPTGVPTSSEEMLRRQVIIDKMKVLNVRNYSAS